MEATSDESEFGRPARDWGAKARRSRFAPDSGNGEGDAKGKIAKRTQNCRGLPNPLLRALTFFSRGLRTFARSASLLAPPVTLGATQAFARLYPGRNLIEIKAPHSADFEARKFARRGQPVDGNPMDAKVFRQFGDGDYPALGHPLA